MMADHKKQPMEKYTANFGPGSESIRHAADLLHDILNDSYACSGTCLETEKNGERINLLSIYWNTKRLLEKTAKNYEKTGFLTMSVIEDAYQTAKPLLLCSLQELLDGKQTVLQNARCLEAILADNPYKQEWAKKEEIYKKILIQLGVDAGSMDFSNLTEMIYPLLDALTFYDTGTKNIQIVREGEPSNNKKPLIAKDIRLYSSEKDFTEALMAEPNVSIIAFGAVEKTNRQTTHPFHEWYYGYPDEYTRNTMRYENLTKEQFLEQVNEYSRKIYLGVKSGETCYLITMPWTTQAPPEENYLYHYGKRVSYAPYQVFFKNHAKNREETLPAVCKNRWLLSEVMDKPSMIWIVAFLDETIRCFFRTDGKFAEEPKRVFLKEEGYITFHCENNITQLPSATETGLSAKSKWEYTVQDPEYYFPEDETARKLFLYFGIRKQDILKVPLGPNGNGTTKEISGEIEDHIRKAYLKTIADRIADLIKTEKRDTYTWMQKWIGQNMERIEKEAAAGTYDEFMECIIDMDPVYNPDGTPKIREEERYPYRKTQVKQKTCKQDAHPVIIPGNMAVQAWFIGPAVTGKPPVLWKIRPASTEHYEKLTGLSKKELPKLLVQCTEIRNFIKKYKHTLPQSYTDNNIYNKNSLRFTGILTDIPDFARINLCMRKNVWKQIKKPKK